MKKANLYIIFFVFLFTIPEIQAYEITGKIISAAGDVHVRQTIDDFSRRELVNGFGVNEYDLITTGNDGLLQVELLSKNQKIMMLTADNNTVFYFYYCRDNINADSQISITILSGNVLLETSPYNPGKNICALIRNLLIELNIADFRVTTAPEGSVLVTCHSGTIRYISNGEEAGYISAGNTLELYQGVMVKEIDIGDQILELYRYDWFLDRERNFREGAFSIIKPAALMYEEYSERFNIYYKELKSLDRIFYNYSRGTVPESADIVYSDLKEVTGSVRDMKRVFFKYEELFYRIEELKRYNDTLPVKGLLRKRYFISDFMEEFSDKYSSISVKLSQVRYYLKIYDYMKEITGKLSLP